jgi:hypothetical protein
VLQFNKERFGHSPMKNSVASWGQERGKFAINTFLSKCLRTRGGYEVVELKKKIKREKSCWATKEKELSGLSSVFASSFLFFFITFVGRSNLFCPNLKLSVKEVIEFVDL